MRRALEISWHHPWLWLLALLAGEGSTGATFNFRVPSGVGSGTRQPGSMPGFSPPGFASPGFSSPSSPVSPPDLQPFAAWLAANLGLLLLAAVAALVLLAILLLLSAAAEAAALRGVDALDAGSAVGLGAAWRLGLPALWPLLWMRLLVFGIGLVVGLAVLALLGLSLLAGFVLHAVPLAVLIGWQWLGLLALLFPVAVAAPTLLRLAARVIALAGAGPWRGLTGAVRLGRRRLGPVAVLWVIELACGFGVGIVFLVASVALLIPLGVAGYAAWRAASAGALVAVGLGAVVVAAVLLVAGAAVAAFFSSYWTIGYRRLVSGQ